MDRERRKSTTNELVVRQRDLPSMPVEDVKQYVDMIGDAINALKTKRNMASHMNYDKTIIDEMERQIREYSALKVKAQLELGKRTQSIQTASGGDRKSESYQKADGRLFEKPKGKWDKLDELGLSHQRASEYERMAENEETVEEYIKDALDSGKSPTKNGALKAIEERRTYIAEEQPSKWGRKSPIQIRAAAKDRDEKISTAISRITNHEMVVEYSIDDLVSEIKANSERFESLLSTILSVHKNLILNNGAGAQIANAIDTFIIKKFEEMKGKISCEEIS